MQLGDKKLIVQRASVGAKNVNPVSASPQHFSTTALVTDSQAVMAKIKTFMKNALLITILNGQHCPINCVKVPVLNLAFVPCRPLL